MWQFFYLICKGHTASNKSTSARLYLDYSSRLIDYANQVKLKSLKYNKQKNCHKIFEIQMNYNVQIKFVCDLSMEEINKKRHSYFDPCLTFLLILGLIPFSK